MEKDMSVVQARVVKALKEVGVNSGDIVQVHCDASLAMSISGAECWDDASEFLRMCFEAALGKNGTLVVPTFYYDFCRGKPYCHEDSPSQVGIFTNYIRRLDGAVRSFHPIFSFAAIGAGAGKLCDNISNSSFGRDSVFGRLHDNNAKIVFFNVPFEQSCSFVHYVEQQAQVKYRYLKYFTGKVSIGGREYIDTFDYYVRYLDRNVELSLLPLTQRLQKSGVIKRVALDNGSILQASCKDIYRHTFQALQDDPQFLLVSAPKPMPLPKVTRVLPTLNNKPFKELDVIAELYPLYRILASDDTDKSLDIIADYLPASAEYVLETYPPTAPVWTWRVPERYVVYEAYLETEDGKRIVDFKDNPLHIVAYSVSIDKIMNWDELEPFLYYSLKRPKAIPWEFKYYQRSWGFCLSKEQFDKLDRSKRYHAVIRSEFVIEPDKGLRIGTALIHPEGGCSSDAGEILICAHICHPYQVNDDLTGVATAIEIAHRLTKNPLPDGSMSVRFLFCPETIGSICYLNHHQDIIPRFKGGIFLDMTANRNTLALQRSLQDNHLIDRIARYVIKRRGIEFREGAFRDVCANDEGVINGPGVNIPCISISRCLYEEYHTSDDNLDIVHQDMMQEAADAVEDVIRIYASNYIPKRTFCGPVFLSAYGLWVDWRVNKELNYAIEKIMLRFEGKHSVFDIAEELNLDYWDVYNYVEKFREYNLVKATAIPSVER